MLATLTKAPMPIEIVFVLVAQAVAFVAKLAIYTGAACFVVRYFWQQSKD